MKNAIFGQVAYIRLYDCQELTLSGHASNVGYSRFWLLVAVMEGVLICTSG